MDKDKFLETITQIGTIEDDVERRTLLTNLSDDISKVFDDKESLDKMITSLQDEIKTTSEKLTKAQAENYNLFKRIGTQKTSAEITGSSTGVNGEPDKPKRKFEDLFKEGGDK